MQHGKPQRGWRVPSNRQPAWDRPGRAGGRRGPYDRSSRVMAVEGRGLG